MIFAFESIWALCLKTRVTLQGRLVGPAPGSQSAESKPGRTSMGLPPAQGACKGSNQAESLLFLREGRFAALALSSES